MFADLPGVRIWFTDGGGNGTPAVFLHAASGTSESWSAQIPAFSSAGYRCVAYDRRFWGRSETNQRGEQPGSAADDLAGLVDHLALQPFHLIATAAGGSATTDFALSHPDRLRSVVISDALAGVRDATYLELQERLRPPEIQALPVELRELSAGYRGTNPVGTEQWIAIARVAWPEGATASRQNPRNQITLAALESLQLPVLLVCGEADLVTPPAQMRMMVGHLPDCEFATIPEAGHAAFWEQPEIWNRTVLDFIGRH
jgi:pimeloyl-ACP methyl ester carboxylesterase